MANFIKAGYRVFDADKVTGYYRSWDGHGNYLTVLLDSGDTLKFTAKFTAGQDAAEDAAREESGRLIDAVVLFFESKFAITEIKPVAPHSPADSAAQP